MSKLAQLLIERLLFNEEFKKYLSDNGINYCELDEECRNSILELLFRNQVDIGKKTLTIGVDYKSYN